MARAASLAVHEDRLGHPIEVDKLGMVFRTASGEIEALRTMDLEIKAGEFVSIVGPSGCGKSTLLRLVAGLEKATSGRVVLNGDVVRKPQTDIGFVFQKPVLLDWRSVLGNVMLQIEARKLPQADYLRRAHELLAKVGLGEFKQAYPHELSGGMSQRVSVCRALVHNPALLLMDEPFGALDALTRDQMMIDLQRLWMGTRQTVLFVTHSVAEAIFLSDRVVVMTPRPGRIERIIELDLPRPRRLALRNTAAFGSVVDEILGIFQTMGVLNEDGDQKHAGAAAKPALTH